MVAPATTSALRRGGGRAGGRLPLLGVAGGLVLVALTSLVSVLVGVQPLPPGDVLDALRGMPVSGETAAIVASRVDRTVIGLVVGAAIALSGVVLQGLTRNPIAEPGILGINSGAALAVVIGIRFLGVSDVGGYVVAALVGTIAVGGARAVADPHGAARQRPRVDGARRRGRHGTGAEPHRRRARHRPWRPRQLPLLAGRLGRGARRDAGARRRALPARRGRPRAHRRADAQRGGPRRRPGPRPRAERALHRGLAPPGRCCSRPAHCALAGPIAFVGLVVPHLVRAVVGVDHRRVLVVSLLLGPVFVVLADTVGRLVARPSEVQAGIICAVVGAPVLVAVVRRVKGL